VTDTPLRLVVMGVAGAGKTTIGARLADVLHIPFTDSDSLHPPANLAKMTAGIPLDDHDRLPWLETAGRRLATGDTGHVIACSALRRRYRDVLRRFAPNALFVHLTADTELLEQRMVARPNHFMPPELLSSQLATLEPLSQDERGFDVDNRVPLDSAIEAILLRLRPAQQLLSAQDQ
jgi:gluconokinase